MRDFRVVTVTLHPVQVNPVTHQARIYRRLSANLVANDRPGENEMLNPRRPSGEWADIYRSQIANLDKHALDKMTTTPGTYLILTKNTTNARQWADSLFIWKTRKGFKVVINTTAGWIRFLDGVGHPQHVHHGRHDRFAPGIRLPHR